MVFWRQKVASWPERRRPKAPPERARPPDSRPKAPTPGAGSAASASKVPTSKEAAPARQGDDLEDCRLAMAAELVEQLGLHAVGFAAVAEAACSTLGFAPLATAADSVRHCYAVTFGEGKVPRSMLKRAWAEPVQASGSVTEAVERSLAAILQPASGATLDMPGYPEFAKATAALCLGRRWLGHTSLFRHQKTANDAIKSGDHLSCKLHKDDSSTHSSCAASVRPTTCSRTRRRAGTSAPSSAATSTSIWLHCGRRSVATARRPFAGPCCSSPSTRQPTRSSPSLLRLPTACTGASRRRSRRTTCCSSMREAWSTPGALVGLQCSRRSRPRLAWTASMERWGASMLR